MFFLNFFLQKTVKNSFEDVVLGVDLVLLLPRFGLVHRDLNDLRGRQNENRFLRFKFNKLLSCNFSSKLIEKKQLIISSRTTEGSYYPKTL